MKTVTKASEVLTNINESAKVHSDDVRLARNLVPGQWVRQGDINVLMVEPFKRIKKERVSERQLAPGNTKGSRHCVDATAEVYSPPKNDPLTGPRIFAKQRFMITHPEHADLSLPSGSYQVTYQRDYAAEERARVMD